MSTFRRDINWAAVSKTTPITPDIKAHLTNVYATLAATIFSAAIGSVFYLATHIGGSFSFLAGFALIIWLFLTPQQEIVKRLGILMGFAFVEGLSIGPLLDATLDIDPTIVTTAFFGTVCIFGCFSASAYFAERRSYLFLGGIIGSSLSAMVVLGILNIFFRSPMVFNLLLYVGLLVFCGYVVFDTQLIIEKAAQGQKDIVGDSLELFLDFISIFIRLLIILSKDNDGKRKRNR